MDETYVDVDGARLRCRFDGPLDAPVLVLSNSLGTDFTMWDPQMRALASAFRVLRYDTRGHGGSAVSPDPYSIERLGRDVIGLMDATGIDRGHFCGLSMGGMTGMWLGIHAPQRLDKLVLANTAARIGPPEQWNARIEKVRVGGMAAIADAVLARWFTPAFHAAHPDAVARMRAMLEHSPIEGYAASCAAVRDADQRESIARITAATLVISGAHDAATPPSDGRFLKQQIADARYVELPAAHIANVEVAAQFTDALLSFLIE